MLYKPFQIVAQSNRQKENKENLEKETNEQKSEKSLHSPMPSPLSGRSH